MLKPMEQVTVENITPTLNSGYTMGGKAKLIGGICYMTPEFRKADNFVVGDQVVVGVMPSNCRPVSSFSLPCYSGTTFIGTLSINTSGDIKYTADNVYRYFGGGTFSFAVG